MTLSRRLLRVYHRAAYVVSWGVFALVGVTLNVVCVPLLLAPNRARRGAAVRAMIRRLFSAWCAWLHATRLIYVQFHGFTPDAMAGAAVYIANHPSLLDATFILSRLPDAICIFKPAIMRNPVLGPAALMAGYASGENGVDLIRDVASRVASGHSLLIFPEGTRTMVGTSLNPLKPGFALIASRAQAPVRVIVVRSPRDLLPKGYRYWRVPSFPSHVDITLVGEIEPFPGETAAELTARASHQLSSALAAT
jgi:1-acyl-sn-glycerol-3-phosphate acyltransferase